MIHFLRARQRFFFTLAAVLVSLVCLSDVANAVQTKVTAIDILMEPDQVMRQKAGKANARLLAVYPQGFSFDATHHPHLSVLQRFVRTADLENVYTVIGKVLESRDASAWKFKAYKYYYIPLGDIGLAGIVSEPTAGLLKLQQDLIDAVAPYTMATGTAAAFATTPEEPDVNQATIDYVTKFVPNATGKHYNPHVSIGIAQKTYLDQMLAEPFEKFYFSPIGVSVYHLGNFGTARIKLHTWVFKSNKGY